MFETIIFLLGGVSVIAFNRVKTILKPETKETAKPSKFKTIGFFTTELKYTDTQRNRQSCSGYSILYEDPLGKRKVEFRFSSTVMNSPSSIDLIKAGREYITLIQPWLEHSLTTQQLINTAGKDFDAAFNGGKEEIEESGNRNPTI